MRSADYVEMTTTSIAGTSGDGAVTCTQITNIPTFTIVFGSQATTCVYAIEDTVNKKFERGIGSVASNVLTRTKPQVTWDGSTLDDSNPAALQFGSSPTSGNIKIRMTPTVSSQSAYRGGANRTVAGDSSWRDYPVSDHWSWTGNGSGGSMTADREYYSYYLLRRGGLLEGVQFDVTTAVGSSNIKWALYSIGSAGLPDQKIVDFVTTATTSTGIKTDTATGSWSPAGPIYLPPGEYAIGFISGHAIGYRSSGGSPTLNTSFGRRGGYGVGDLIYVSGSYSTGMPATPSLGSATMADPGAFGGKVWVGLKVTP